MRQTERDLYNIVTQSETYILFQRLKSNDRSQHHLFETINCTVTLE